MISDADEELSSEEIRAALQLAGVDLNTPQRVTSLAALGRHTSKAGDLDYCIGALTEQVEQLRAGAQQAGVLWDDCETIKERIDLLDKRARISTAVTQTVGQLIEASKLNGDRRGRDKSKSRSFSPEQVIVPVQVNVTTNTAAEPKPAQATI